jgi:hypothetical protein
MLVFIISGLWHGANWTFFIWGSIHGFYLVFSIVTKNLRESISRFIRIDKFIFIQKLYKILVTFHLVLFAWIFFRANNLNDALYVVKNIFVDINIHNFFNTLVFGRNYFYLVLFFVFIVQLSDIFREKINLKKYFNNKNIFFRWAVYYAIIFLILLFGVFEKQEFIYFQF